MYRRFIINVFDVAMYTMMQASLFLKLRVVQYYILTTRMTTT